MKWVAKAAAFNFVSVAPGGERLYRLLQDRVTGSTRITKGTILQKMRAAQDYLHYLEQEPLAPALSEATAVDIGAGWTPTIPLMFYAAGVDRQELCDVRRHMRVETVREVVDTFRDLMSEHPDLFSSYGRLPPEVQPGETLDTYLGRLGIRYMAPYSLSELRGLDGPKIITCTQMLMHLSKPQVAQLFSELGAVLRMGGGVLLATVHLHDLYADSDPRLSPYNKWRYSPFVWERLINSNFMHYNRLTGADYRDLLQRAGLEPLAFEVPEPEASDLAELGRVRVHRAFSDRRPEDLAGRFLFFAAAPGT